MSGKESQTLRVEREDGKTITIKINVAGPADLLSWVQANTPDKIAGRLMGFLPADFRKHVRAARREQLLAVRSLLDAAIARTEMEEQPQRRATKVEIE